MGAQDISFEPIVGFRKILQCLTTKNTDRKLKNNELVLIDMGMKYQEYCSDMTRTFSLGKAVANNIQFTTWYLNHN